MSLWFNLEADDESVKCSHCGGTGIDIDEVYSRNITHNLTAMANAAGIYDCLWRPDDKGFERAEQIIELLQKGLKRLRKRPDHFRRYNASNGWGTYEHFVPFVEEILAACVANPKAKIRVSR